MIQSSVIVSTVEKNTCCLLIAHGPNGSFNIFNQVGAKMAPVM